MSRPKLLGSPSNQLPCKPTLFLGIENWAVEELSTVLIHDLAFCNTSEYQPNLTERNTALEILSNLEGKELIQTTKAYGGSVIVEYGDLFDHSGVIQDRLSALASDRQVYQAIIVGDGELIGFPEIARFCSQQFHENGVSVVIMALEGYFDLSVINNNFGVNWRHTAYTRRDLCLSERGQTILTSWAFPSRSKYIKSNLINSDRPEEEHLLMDDPEGGREPGDQEPGSAVVISIREQNAVSYFGFVSSPTEWYGPIIHRLCYAAEIQHPEHRR